MNNRMTVPNVSFKTRVRDESIGGSNPYRWQIVTTDDLFANKKVVVFSLPGAFTPTCSTYQLPNYEKMFDEFRACGVDEIYCLSVNDSFVMNAWMKTQQIEKVKPIPDGNAEFTKKMGYLVQKNNLGFGDRSWRYSMYVEDRKILKIFEEAGFEDNIMNDPYEVSDPQTMLNFLKSIQN